MSDLEVRLVSGEADLASAQRLRYRVFVEELGGSGPLVDHAARREMDEFDAHCDHLVLTDSSRPEGDHVVGVYRLMQAHHAQAAGRFYCASEYDLEPLLNSGRPLLELGRSCVDPAYRRGMGLPMMWQALGGYVAEHGIEILFGVASFHGTDTKALAAPLSLLCHEYLAPEALRARSRIHQPMDLIPADMLDRKAAMQAIPALIKGYLRLGGFVGDGAYVDHAFNTTDVLLMMDTERLNARAANRYRR